MPNDSDSFTDSTPITKLHGPEDYQIWKIRLQGRCLKRGVWDTFKLNGTDVEPPAIITNPPSTQSATAGSTVSNAEAVAEWRSRNQRATAILWETLSDTLIFEICNYPKAADAYSKIIEKFEKTNVAATSFSTLLTLIKTSWDGTSDFGEHVAKFSKIKAKFASLDQAIPDHFITFFFLRSLPNTPIWDRKFSAPPCSTATPISRSSLSRTSRLALPAK